MKSIIYTSADNDLLIIDLAKEYANYKDSVPYAFVTELTEEELNAKYAIEIQLYSPFVIITKEMYMAMAETSRNDETERVRAIRFHSPVPFEDLIKVPADKMSDPAFATESYETANSIVEKMKALPGHQGSRMYKRYILNLTAKEIALEEGVTIRKVRRCLFHAKKNLLKEFKKYGVIKND